MALLCTVLIVAGCSDSGSSAKLSPETFVAQYAAAWCDGLQRCCEQDGNPFDEQWCSEQAAGRFSVPSWDFAFDETAARRCLQQVREEEPLCGGQGESPVRCFGVFGPTREPGEPCQTSEECKGPSELEVAYCVAEGPGAGGVCFVPASPVRAGAGDRCGFSCNQEICSFLYASLGACYASDGLYCSSESGACEPLGELGDSCSAFDLPCRDELYCASSCDPVSGACEERGRCAERIAPGAPCDGEDYDACADRGICSTADCGSVTTSPARASDCRSVCVVPAGEGEPCASSPFGFAQCAFPLVCAGETGTCAQPGDVGEPCVSGQCAGFLFCDADEGRCTLPRDAGAPCTESVQCASYHCSSDDRRSESARAIGEEGSCLPVPSTSIGECSPPPLPTPPGSAQGE